MSKTQAFQFPESAILASKQAYQRQLWTRLYIKLSVQPLSDAECYKKLISYMILCFISNQDVLCHCVKHVCFTLNIQMKYLVCMVTWMHYFAIQFEHLILMYRYTG